MKARGAQLQHKVKIEWSSNFAYAIGLLASDGHLTKDGRHIVFTSKDEELVLKFKKALSLNNKISKNARGGETEKKYYRIQFGDKAFYQYLNSRGLTSAKSKTIKAVAVPDEYFSDFLRGEFDGDGSFYSYWDKRWPNSFVYQIALYSASLPFIDWLKEKNAKFYGTAGHIKHFKNAGVYGIIYTKSDTRRLVDVMYHPFAALYLNRKYDKIMIALKNDPNRKASY